MLEQKARENAEREKELRDRGTAMGHALSQALTGMLNNVAVDREEPKLNPESRQ